MRSFVLIAFVAVVGLVCASDNEKYTIKYDNVNLDDILANERLLKNYYNCLMDQGTCTNDGQELKNILPDALKTECSKCSEKQREGAKKVIQHLVNYQCKMWLALEEKYDKEGNYRNKYKDTADKEGVSFENCKA